MEEDAVDHHALSSSSSSSYWSEAGWKPGGIPGGALLRLAEYRKAAHEAEQAWIDVAGCTRLACGGEDVDVARAVSRLTDLDERHSFIQRRLHALQALCGRLTRCNKLIDRQLAKAAESASAILQGCIGRRHAAAIAAAGAAAAASTTTNNYEDGMDAFQGTNDDNVDADTAADVAAAAADALAKHACERAAWKACACAADTI
jgi:hypothetical protein